MPWHGFFDDYTGTETNLDFVFRRPVLIPPEKLVNALNKSSSYSYGLDGFSAILRQDIPGIEQGISSKGVIEPIVVTENHFACLITLPRLSFQIARRPVGKWWRLERDLDGNTLSRQQVFRFPVKSTNEDLDKYLSLEVTRNHPHKRNGNCGSIAFPCYDIPWTGISFVLGDYSERDYLGRPMLYFDEDWYRKSRAEDALYELKEADLDEDFWYLWWRFYELFRDGNFIRILVEQGVEVAPEPHPDWNYCEIDDQCQECGYITRSLPVRKEEVIKMLGEYTTNFCENCKGWDYVEDKSHETPFQVVGCYPISPQDTEIAATYGMLQSDHD